MENGQRRFLILAICAFLLFTLIGTAVAETVVNSDSLAAAGAGLGPTSLCEAVKAAVATHPSMLAVKAAKRAADAGVRRARAGFWPSIGLRLGTGSEYSDNEATRSRVAGVDDSGSDTLWRNESSISLSQMLFDGFETRNLTTASEKRAEAAVHEVLDTGNTIGVTAAEAYLDILRYRQLGGLVRKNLEDHREILAKVKFRAAKGGGTIADVRQTEARVATAESTLVDIESAIRDSVTRYREVVGDRPHGLQMPVPPLASMPPDREKAVSVALANSPAVKQAAALVAQHQAEHEAVRAAYYPRVSFEVNGSNNRNLDGLEARSKDVSGMLVLRYDIYQGGKRSAETRQALETLQEAEHRLDETRNRVEKLTDLAFNALVAAKARLPILKNNVVYGEQVLSAYRDQFELGRRSLLDLLNAQNELFQARAALINGEFTGLFAHYRVLAATGTLLDALEIKAQ